MKCSNYRNANRDRYFRKELDDSKKKFDEIVKYQQIWLHFEAKRVKNGEKNLVVVVI